MAEHKGIEAVSVILSDYSDEVREAFQGTVEDVMNDAAKKMRQAGSFNGKAYKRSWKAQTEKTRTGVSGVTYNEKHYRLTHLLEYGHAKQNGGRTRAFEHIAPVNDWAQEEVEKRMEDKLK